MYTVLLGKKNVKNFNERIWKKPESGRCNYANNN
jgi:hypothetical protein